MHFYRFNTEDYPRSIGIVLDPLHPHKAVLLGPKGEAVRLGAARGHWIRRPRWPVISEDVTDELDRQLAVQESVAAIGGFWRLVADRCVSPPDALQAARWKLPQLRLARRLGFQVPDTLVTTDPTAIAAFRAASRTVVKAVQDARVAVGAQERYGFARELADDEPMAGAAAAPVLVQRLVTKVADVRVTVVGTRIFPVRITTPADRPIDFREAGSDSSAFEVATLSITASTACVRFVEAYGLRFGAFDFAEDVDGSLWFLECNPSGQWAWLERRTGLPITAALMDLLLAPRQ